MEENWKQWKKNLFSRYNKNPFLKKIEKERNKYKGGIVEEWNEEDDNEEDWWRIKEDRKYLEGLENENQNMGNLRDPYDKLQKSPWNKDPWKKGGVMNCLIPLRQYLFSFSFSFLLIIRHMRTYYQIRKCDSIGKYERNLMCTNK